MSELSDRLRRRAFRLAVREMNGDGAKLGKEAADRIDELEAEIERLKDDLKVSPCALLGKCVGPSMTKDGARLVAENARLREALEEIATGRDKNGEITDFPRERASAALGIEGKSGS